MDVDNPPCNSISILPFGIFRRSVLVFARYEAIHEFIGLWIASSTRKDGGSRDSEQYSQNQP